MKKLSKLLSILLSELLAYQMISGVNINATKDSITFYDVKNNILDLKAYDAELDTNHDGNMNVFDAIRANKTLIQEESYTDLKEKVYMLETQIESLYQKLGDKVDEEEGKQLSSNDYTDEERQKLESLNNYDDAKLKTELQNQSDLIDCLVNIANEEKNKYDSLILDIENNKVDKEEGKQLSSNDYTDEEKQKLEGLNNYDDTEIKNDITAIKSELNQIDTIVQDLNKENDIKQSDTKRYVLSTSGTLSESNILSLGENHIKTNKHLAIVGNFSTMGKLRVGHGNSEYPANYITIDSTNINHYASNVLVQTIPHGLTMINNIQVIIDVGNEHDASVTVRSSGYSFKVKLNNVWQGCVGDVYASAESGLFTNVVLSWTCDGYKKDIQMYGDSYFSTADDTRWGYYLREDGFSDNVLFDGYPGRSSEIAFKMVLKNYTHSTPKYIVWCVGMNDPDTATEINSNWLETYKKLKTFCDENEIELVLSTIPNTPTVNNVFKNDYIRNSGLRYIDFANAVQTLNSSTWYAGMLSEDNVHPTELGASALYMQVISDFPEIMCNH